MSAYMGAGSVRVGVQVQGCPLVNTTSKRKIKERVMYVCTVLSQVAALILHMSDLIAVSVDCLHVLQPARSPGTTPALTTPFCKRRWQSLLLSSSKPHIYLLIPVFVRSVSCHLFQFHLALNAWLNVGYYSSQFRTTSNFCKVIHNCPPPFQYKF